MRLQVRLIGEVISLETGSLKNQFEDTLHIAVEYGFFQLAALYPCHDVLILFVVTGLQHVIAGLHLCHGILAAKPVRHHHTFKSPFVTQERSLQLRILRGIYAIHIVIGRHYGPGGRFLHGNFKAFQIYLAQSTGRYLGIICHTVCFLVIDGKVFDGGSHTIALHATYVCSRNLSTHQRVFGIVFKVSPAKRMPLDIQGRCQQYIHAVFQNLVTDSLTHTLHKLLVPRGSKQSPYGEMGAIISSSVSLTRRVDTESCRTVGQDYGRNAEPGNGVSGSGRTGNQAACLTHHGAVAIFKSFHTGANHQMRLFFQSHGGNYIVQRCFSKLWRTRPASHEGGCDKYHRA